MKRREFLSGAVLGAAFLGGSERPGHPTLATIVGGQVVYDARGSREKEP